MLKNRRDAMQTSLGGVLTRLGARCRLAEWGTLVMVLFALLGGAQAWAACNIGFTATAGGQVSKSGSTYVYTFNQMDYDNCDPGATVDGSGSGMGIYVDAAESQNPAGSAFTYPTTSAQAPSHATTNNVYVISECCAPGTANVNSFRYTPPAGFSGTDTFPFYYYPSGGSLTLATVTVTVPSYGPAVTSLTPTAGGIAGGTSVTIGGSGFTGATAVKFGSTTAPSYTVSNDTTISATAPAGGAGSVYVTVTTAQGTSSASSSSTFTYVAPVAAGAVSATVGHGTSNNSIALNTSGGTATSVAVATAASHGTASAVGTAISYTPTTAYSGSDSFTYTATNAAGTSSPATVTVTVSAPTLAISPTSGTALTGTSTASYSRNFIPSGGTAPYSYAVAVNSGSMPAGLSLSASTGVLSGTPTTSGAVNFTVTATDSSTGTGPFSVSGTYDLTVAAVQTGTLSFATPTSATVTLGNSLTNLATSTLSGGGYGAIGYSSSDTAVATVNASSGTVTTHAPGTAVITATQAAVAGVNGPASQSYTLTVSALPVGTLNFGTPTSASVILGGSLTNSASSTLSGGGYGVISYTSSNTGVATVNASGTITTVSAGTTVITATQAAVAGVNAQASQSYTLTVNPLPIGTVTFATPGSATVALGNTLNNRASSTLSGGSYGAISYSSANTAVATVNASTGVVTPVSVGSVAITATQAATGANAQASQSYTLTVSALPVGTLDFGTPTSASVSMGGSLTNTARSTLSGGSYGAISYSSANTSIATVNAGSGVVTPVSVGSVVITATQAATAANAQASQSYTLTVNPLPIGTVTFATPGSAAVTLGNTLSNRANSSLSGGSYGAISYSSANTSVATVNASTGVVTPVSAGSVAITATQAATGANAQASQSYTLTVHALSIATLSFATPTSATVSMGATLTNAATSTLSGGSYGAISYSSGNTAVATVNARTGVVLPVNVGTAVITATQAAVAGVNAQATQTYTVTVNQSLPTVNPVSAVVAYGSNNNPIALNVSGAATSVMVASAPSHGTATAAGLTIRYSPAAGFSGSDSFTYAATNAAGSSAPATVTILVQLRPDPGKDAEVKGMLSAQQDTAKRFSDAQISNVQTRLEGLHARSRTLWRDEQTISARQTTGARSSTNPTSATGSEDFGAPVIAARNLGQLRKNSNTLGQITDVDTCTTAGAGGLSSGNPSATAQAKAADSQSLSGLWPWKTLNLAGKTDDPFGYGMELWSAGTISIGRQSQSDARFSTAGISVGSDSRVSENLIIGMGAGFGHEHQKIGDSGSRERVDGYSMVVYGSYQPKEGVFIDGLAGYGQMNFDAQRYVTTTGDLIQSQRQGRQWFSSFAGGYEYVEGNSLLSPYGRIDLSSVHLNESTESGGGIYDLVYSEQTTQSRKLALGLRGETRVVIDSGLIKPSFRIEYQHEFANPGIAHIRYADQLFGTVYQFDMENTDRNTVAVGLGCDFEFRKGWGGTLSYRFGHSTSSASQSSALGAQLRRSF